MNYKEALQNSLETFTTEEFEYDDPITVEHVVRSRKSLYQSHSRRLLCTWRRLWYGWRTVC